MSIQARKALVASPYTIFQHDSQRQDLLNPNLTRTGLIALLFVPVQFSSPVEFTAIRSDHHDDSALGPHSHANGDAADLWPLDKPQAGQYLDAANARFPLFLSRLADSPWCEGIGLAGSANTPKNLAACGAKGFVDEGGDHVHVQAAL